MCIALVQFCNKKSAFGATKKFKKFFMESWRFHKNLNLTSFYVAKAEKIILYLMIVRFGVFLAS